VRPGRARQLSVRSGLDTGERRGEDVPDDAARRGTDRSGIQVDHAVSGRRWEVDGHAFGRAVAACAGRSVRCTVMVEAIPDKGCCGWSNVSNDQTLVLVNGKTRTIFDELETYKNADYDVSFYTSNAKLSPELGSVAMTIVSTGQVNKAIQLTESGEANPESCCGFVRA